MIRRATWNYSTATAHAGIFDGISVVTISGVVTPSVASRVLADNAKWLREAGTLAQVASYQYANLSIGADALLASAIEHTASGLDVPTALLVMHDQYHLFSAYSSLMARHGVCRAPILQWEPALLWAREQAAVMAQMRYGFRPSAARTTDPSLPRPGSHQSGGQSLAPQDWAAVRTDRPSRAV